MKLFASLCLLAALCLSARAQEQSKKKNADKDRQKLPVEMFINATPAKLKSLFLAEYARHEWQLEKETASSITFTKRANLAASFAYGRSSRYEDIVTITEQETGKTLVIIDSGVQQPQGGGAFQRFNLNADKKNRKQNEDLLQRVRTSAEKPAN